MSLISRTLAGDQHRDKRCEQQEIIALTVGVISKSLRLLAVVQPAFAWQSSLVLLAYSLFSSGIRTGKRSMKCNIGVAYAL